MELLVRLNNEQGQTFVLVTHSEDVGAVTDRIVRMSDGVVISTSDATHGSSSASNVSSGASTNI